MRGARVVGRGLVVERARAYDEPLPASSAGAPAARSTAAWNSREPRLDVLGGGFEVVAQRREARRSSTVVADRAAERRPTRGTRRRSRSRTAGSRPRRERAAASTGSRSSPIPRIAHAPPLQAERHVGAERRGDALDVEVVRRSRDRPRTVSTAAASAEPPPSPRAGGMPLCSSIATFAPSASRRAHGEVRRRRSGRRRANGPVDRRSTSSARARITSSSCGSLTDTTSASRSW